MAGSKWPLLTSSAGSSTLPAFLSKSDQYRQFDLKHSAPPRVDRMRLMLPSNWRCEQQRSTREEGADAGRRVHRVSVALLASHSLSPSSSSPSAWAQPSQPLTKRSRTCRRVAKWTRRGDECRPLEQARSSADRAGSRLGKYANRRKGPAMVCAARCLSARLMFAQTSQIASQHPNSGRIQERLNLIELLPSALGHLSAAMSMGVSQALRTLQSNNLPVVRRQRL
jgi:hypothetical protein